MVDRDKVREIVARAAGLPVAERAGLLEVECGGDGALRAEVESLLAAADRNPGFMASPTGGGVGSAAGGLLGSRIGPYKVLEEIGQGGFGSVYLAEQDHPVRRRVALKVIKLGMDTRAVIARFEAERQALAMMDHAHIAKVFDAGITDAAQGGRPYFVMELVRGDPITVYADRAGLTIAERLALFIQVCRALQHAHSKGVIHRDIKPGNVLVTMQDGRPHAKVIDFGIAKATEQRLTEKTVYTEFRQLIGTPEYMSPEQAGGAPDVDTRSDVYSLGVLLYELLTGATPFDPRELRSAAYEEIQRIIREVEPPKPSTRLSRLAGLASIAALRRIEPARLSALVAGEIDWIVMKALDKDRSRRYETASALAADLSRHMAGEPVSAAPPGAVYRVRKFVARHRGPVLALVAVCAALVAGAVVSITYGIEEARQRREAVEAGERAGRAEAAATKRAEELRRIVRFQEGQLRGIDVARVGVNLRNDLVAKVRAAAERARAPAEEVERRVAELEALLEGADFTGMARAILEESIFRPSLAAVSERFADQPLVRASLLQVLSDNLVLVGLYESARAPQDEALEIRRRMLGDDHEDTLISIFGAGIRSFKSQEFGDAERLLSEAVERRDRVLGATHEWTLTAALDLGFLHQTRGNLDRAEALYRRVLTDSPPDPSGEAPLALDVGSRLGILLLARGRHAEAESLLRDTLERRRRVLGADHARTIESLGHLGLALQGLRRHREAEPVFREALERSRQQFGADHPSTQVALNNVGLVLLSMGRRADAEPHLREAIGIQRRTIGSRHTHTLTSISNLGFLLTLDGKHAEGEPLFREAVEGLTIMVGEEYPTTLYAKIGLGTVLTNTGRVREAIDLLEPAEPVARRVFVNDLVARLSDFLCTLGKARQSAGDLDGAEADFTDAYEAMRGARAGQADALRNLVNLYEARHRLQPDRGFDKQRDRWRAEWEAAKAAPRP